MLLASAGEFPQALAKFKDAQQRSTAEAASESAAELALELHKWVGHTHQKMGENSAAQVRCVRSARPAPLSAGRGEKGAGVQLLCGTGPAWVRGQCCGTPLLMAAAHSRRCRLCTVIPPPPPTPA